jgi:hypothetical protein
MSFLDDIVEFAAPVLDFFTGGTVGTIIQTAAAGFALNQIVNSVSPAPANNSSPSGGGGTSGATTVDPGVRQQIPASTANSIPVVYGHATLGGKIFDAVISDDNSTMWFAMAICERTTEYTLAGEWRHAIAFENVYWNGQRCVFQGDGDYNTVITLVDDKSGKSTDISNSNDSPLKIYMYNRGSRYSTITRTHWNPGDGYYGGGDGRGPWAMNVMPNWTANHTADDLVFAIVRVKYNKALGFTGLGDVQFEVTNAISQPGDVLFDYMINPRYGAGINAADIAQ